MSFQKKFDAVFQRKASFIEAAKQQDSKLLDGGNNHPLKLDGPLTLSDSAAEASTEHHKPDQLFVVQQDFSVVTSR